MKDFSKATPRPWWASGESSSNGAYKIEDAEGWHVAWIKEKKDVHLIVTAVNNFDDLSKFLRMVNDCLNDGIPIEKNDPVHNVAKQLLESLK